MTLDITLKQSVNSRINEVDFDNIKFGRVFSDHQFIAEYNGNEWVNLRVEPYGPISMSPAISALHYGQSIFEGMKAYKDPNGNALLFRPLDNWRRLNASARRMGMVELPQDVFMEGLTRLMELDKNWIPTKEGSALYIRPFLFATDDFIGVRPSDNYSFIIFSCPVNAYYTQPLRVMTSDQYIRAAEGGVGATKCAGNYGSVMLPTREAQEKGFNQVLWLDAAHREFIEETGTTNLFVRINDTLLTPSLQKGTILAGITRDSIIQLAKHRGWDLVERDISIHELLSAHQNGSLKEVFASGTAATVAPIATISHNGQEMNLSDSSNWEYFNDLSQTIEAIKTGTHEDLFGWVHKI